MATVTVTKAIDFSIAVGIGVYVMIDTGINSAGMLVAFVLSILFDILRAVQHESNEQD